jgi:hypothetical protein
MVPDSPETETARPEVLNMARRYTVKDELPSQLAPKKRGFSALTPEHPASRRCRQRRFAAYGIFGPGWSLNGYARFRAHPLLTVILCATVAGLLGGCLHLDEDGGGNDNQNNTATNNDASVPDAAVDAGGNTNGNTNTNGNFNTNGNTNGNFNTNGNTNGNLNFHAHGEPAPPEEPQAHGRPEQPQAHGPDRLAPLAAPEPPAPVRPDPELDPEPFRRW